MNVIIIIERNAFDQFISRGQRGKPEIFFSGNK
jgi:hypothetical protein